MASQTRPTVPRDGSGRILDGPSACLALSDYLQDPFSVLAARVDIASAAASTREQQRDVMTRAKVGLLKQIQHDWTDP